MIAEEEEVVVDALDVLEQAKEEMRIVRSTKKSKFTNYYEYSWGRGSGGVNTDKNAVKNINPGATAFYSVVTDKIFAYSTNTACHAGLASFPVDSAKVGKPRYVITYINVNYGSQCCSQEVYKKWYEAIANNKPWDDVFITKTYEEALDSGAVCRADVPSNLMAGACFSIRQPWEHPSNINAAVKLMDEGVHPSLAILMSHGMQLYKDDYAPREALGHQGLNLSCMDRRGFHNFMQGIMDKPNPLYSEHSSYNGVDYLWNSHTSGSKLSTLLSEAISEVKRGVSNKPRVNPWICPFPIPEGLELASGEVVKTDQHPVGKAISIRFLEKVGEFKHA